MPDDVSAVHLLLTGDPALLAIVRLSLMVTFSAVLLAALIGVPFGALMALIRFPCREGIIVVLNALMGLPPVVVGLVVFLALSRSGPLGSWGLLFTPKAMVIAQTVLVTPIIAALTRQTIEDLWIEYRDEMSAMNIGPAGRVMTLIWDARFSLVTALLAGFGRAAAEVGAIIIVGGNIEGFTRTMTTAIALETSKGDVPLAVGLGMVLIAIVVGDDPGSYRTDAEPRTADCFGRPKRFWKKHAVARRDGPGNSIAGAHKLGRTGGCPSDAACHRVSAPRDVQAQCRWQCPLCAACVRRRASGTEPPY
jgi:tungstate transport system permease protein